MSLDSLGPTLDQANLVFRAAYGKAQSDSELQAPLLVLLAAELALHVARERRAFPFSHPPFHTTKVVAHIAVALYATTAPTDAGDMPVRIGRRCRAVPRPPSADSSLIRARGANSNLEALLQFAVLKPRASAVRGARTEAGRLESTSLARRLPPHPGKVGEANR
jgi:hypothetical protein